MRPMIGAGALGIAPAEQDLVARRDLGAEHDPALAADRSPSGCARDSRRYRSPPPAARRRSTPPRRRGSLRQLRADILVEHRQRRAAVDRHDDVVARLVDPVHRADRRAALRQPGRDGDLGRQHAARRCRPCRGRSRAARHPLTSPASSGSAQRCDMRPPTRNAPLAAAASTVARSKSGQRGSPWTSARLGDTASIQLAWWRGRSAAGSSVAPNRRKPSGGSGSGHDDRRVGFRRPRARRAQTPSPTPPTQDAIPVPAASSRTISGSTERGRLADIEDAEGCALRRPAAGRGSCAARVAGSPSANGGGERRAHDAPPISLATIGRDALDQHRDAALVGVESVRLIELRFHRHTFEKKWIKRHPVRLRKLGIDAVELLLVLLAPIGRGVHADEQQLGAARLDLCRSSCRDWRAPVAGSMPRSVSLAPSSRITRSGLSASAQSSRARPPAVVSPETPALTTCTCDPSARSRASRRAGKACSAGSPKPGGQAVAKREDLGHARSRHA